MRIRPSKKHWTGHEQWEHVGNTVCKFSTSHAPSLPVVVNDAAAEHREKNHPSALQGLAVVARSLAKKEALAKPTAIAAMQKVCQSLRDKGVWCESEAREKEDVIREANEQGVHRQFGHVHCRCAEKNAELPDNHPSRQFKGRVVFPGNQVTNQCFETAAFADLGNSPATLEGARMADLYGWCRGNLLQQAGAHQAYIQADTRGDPCWISLPIDAVVDKGAWRRYRQPVVRLRKALCLASGFSRLVGRENAA